MGYEKSKIKTWLAIAGATIVAIAVGIISFFAGGIGKGESSNKRKIKKRKKDNEKIIDEIDDFLDDNSTLDKL